MNLMLPNFKIIDAGSISIKFLREGIIDFHQALKHISQLPYGRNTDRIDYHLVLIEKRGTCSTKHALLSALCHEHTITDIKLFTGIYEMTENNTPGIGHVLKKYNLNSIPEAHCYLKWNGQRFDFTNSNESKIEQFLIEKQIQPNQIGQYKIDLHKNYVNQWLKDNKLHCKFDLESLWQVREECIKELSTNS